MSTSDLSSETELERLRQAVRRRFGTACDIADVVVPTLGGSNRTVVFDLVDGSARRRLVSRRETYRAADSPFRPTSAQFRLMQIVCAHGFPAPEPVFELDETDGLGPGFVTEFVAGETMPNRILMAPELAELRPQLVAQMAGHLALLHAIDPAEAGFLGDYPDSADAVAAQRHRLDLYAGAHPAIELGLRWLERHRPAGTPKCLLHGDFRLGNILVGPRGIAAVLDWECAHLGAVAEEIGWLCTRSWRFAKVEHPVAGLGSREDFCAAYCAAGGAHIDIEEIRYWEVFGLVRWAALNLMQGHGHAFGTRRSPVFAACGRNAALIEYDLLMTLAGHYD